MKTIIPTGNAFFAGHPKERVCAGIRTVGSTHVTDLQQFETDFWQACNTGDIDAFALYREASIGIGRNMMLI
ncbi:MAG: hypothetical protein WCZ66_09685 [Sphingomonadaceae bacterium]